MRVVRDDHIVDYNSTLNDHSRATDAKFKYPPPPSWTRYRKTNLGVVVPLSVDKRGRAIYDETKYAYDKPRNVFLDIDRSKPDRQPAVSQTYKSVYTPINPHIIESESDPPLNRRPKSNKLLAAEAQRDLIRAGYDSWREDGRYREEYLRRFGRKDHITSLRNGLFQVALSRLLR